MGRVSVSVNSLFMGKAKRDEALRGSWGVKNNDVLRDSLSVTLSEFHSFIKFEINSKINIVV